MSFRPRVLVGLYAVSGAAALVYETVWTRLLTMQFGQTVAAVSTVLGAFMAGLAAGAWMGGRAIARLDTRLLTAYAGLELIIAAAALVLPTALGLSTPLLVWAYADGTMPARFAFARIAIAFGCLMVPAMAMGATYPIASAWMARTKSPARSGGGNGAALLYAANTSGAAAGAIATGFWLIPVLGLRMTTWVGVAFNVVAVLGAAWLSSSGEAAEQAAPAGAAPGRRSRDGALDHPHPVVALVGATLCGFSGLAYEVGFTRLIALVIGPTTYAFATMTGGFIAGLAIGSAAGSSFSPRTGRPAVWLSGLLMASGVSASWAAWFLATRMPLLVASTVATHGVSFTSILTREAVVIAAVLLPTAVALGAAFPFALATAMPGRTPIDVGAARVYAVNTLGAIAGALAGGFVLVPAFGLQTTFTALGIASSVSGLALIAAAGQRAAPSGLRRGVLIAGAAALLVLAILARPPEWDRDLLASGAYKYAARVAGNEAALRAGRIEYYKEGAAGAVSIRRLGGVLSLAIDGKVDASNAGDMLTQRLLGLLPLLLHGHPQDVCIIGLGSGVTLDSALAMGTVRRADVVEISPEVVEASAWFAESNHRALQAPGVRLIAGDGRSHLALTTRRYDAIISEPSNPWMAGVASLFTREFFQAARQRLTDDGVFCQWAHTYEIADGDLRSIAATFLSVFPQGTMWLVGDGDLLLVGSVGREIEERLATVRTGLDRPAVISVLADVGVVPASAAFQLLSLFVAGPSDLARYAAGATLQDDDRTALEFTAPQALYGHETNTNTPLIRAFADRAARPAAVAGAFSGASAADWTARGDMALKADASELAYESFRRAAALDSHRREALRGVSEAAAMGHRSDEARTWLQQLVEREPANVTARVELSRVYAAAGQYQAAIESAREAVRLEDVSPEPIEQMASIFADMGDASRLVPLADALFARYPDREECRYLHAAALFMTHRGAEAVFEAQRLVERNPRFARAQNLLGAACATTGQRDCARAAFDASIRLNPKDASAYVNFGLFELQGGDASRAEEYFADAAALDPTLEAARTGLEQVRAALNRR